MPAFSVILLALIPLLLAASACCAGSETALFSLTAADRLRLRKSAPSAHARIVYMLADSRSLLILILLGNVMASTAYFTVFALGSAGLASWLMHAGGFSSGGEDGSRALAWVARGVSLAGVFLFIVLGEVLPKSIAAVHRVRIAGLISGPAFLAFGALRPLRMVLDRLVIAPLSRLFRPTAAGGASELSPEELSGLLEAAQRSGVLASDEQALIGDVVELGHLRVKDIMTPRVDVRWLLATDTSQELLHKARETGWTRYPVCRGTLDAKNLVGVVNANRVLAKLHHHGAAARLPLQALVEPARFVPDRSRVDQLLEFFRRTKADMALVVNEAGDLTGMVQIDNVVDVLLASASVETPSPTSGVTMVRYGEWDVPGRLSVRDWQAFFDAGDGTAQARSRSVTTVAGLVVLRLGRLPRVGDEVVMGNLKLRVDAMSGRVVDRVRVLLHNVKQPDPAPLGAGKGGEA